MSKHKEIIEENTLVEFLDILEEYLTLLHQVAVGRVEILRGRGIQGEKERERERERERP